MNFGISSACFYPKYTEDAVKKLAENNVKYIEIFLNTYSELSEGFLNTIKPILADNQMQVTSIHPFTSAQEPIMFFSEYERRFVDSIEEYKKYFDFTSKIGAEILVFHGNSNKSTFPEEKYFERFAKLKQVGKEMGVIVAQENVAPYKSHSLDFLRRMKKYFNDDVSFVLDLKQTLRSNENVFDYIRELNKNIAHIHISDNNENLDCLPIGKGNFNFTLLFEELRKINYQKAMILELYSHNYRDECELYNSLEILQKIHKN